MQREGDRTAAWRWRPSRRQRRGEKRRWRPRRIRHLVREVCAGTGPLRRVSHVQGIDLRGGPSPCLGWQGASGERALPVRRAEIR